MHVAHTDVDRPSGAPDSPVRVRVDGLPESERQHSMYMHLSLLSAVMLWPLFPIAPLLLWRFLRKDSVFIDDHGREALNFSITFVLAHLVFGFIPIVSVIVLVPLWLIGLISLVRAAMAAHRGEYFRYPMTLRLV